jgi:hypothetical protein
MDYDLGEPEDTRLRDLFRTRAHVEARRTAEADVTEARLREMATGACGDCYDWMRLDTPPPTTAPPTRQYPVLERYLSAVGNFLTRKIF